MNLGIRGLRARGAGASINIQASSGGRILGWVLVGRLKNAAAAPACLRSVFL